MARHWMTLVLIAACGGEPAPAGSGGGGGPTTGDPDTPPVATSLGSDEAHVTLMVLGPQHDVPAQNILAAVFAEADRGWVNLAQCLTRPGTYCAQEFPTEPGAWTEITAYDDRIGEAILTRDMGDTVGLGPWSAEYVWDEERFLGYYFHDIGIPESVPNELGFTLEGGDWPRYRGDADIAMPAQMLVQSPDPRTRHAFHSAKRVELRWTPGGPGDVYLAVVTPSDSRLYRLDDTGAFDLDLAAFDIWDFAQITLALGRWTFTELDLEGNRVTLQVQSDQYIHGEFRDVDGRTELAPAAGCEDAASMPPLAPGAFYGDISELGNDLNPGAFGCTGFGAGGPDGLLKLVLEPNQYVEVVYQLPQDDASIYIVEDCERAGTCLTGSDSQGTDPEVLSWFNDGDAREIVWLVLDAFKYPGVPAVTDLFYLDVEYTDLLADVLLPECADAIDAPPLETGAYVGDLAGHDNVLDPSANPSCAVPAPGGEGIALVQLAPYERVTVEVSMPAGDPILYWLYQCNLIESCAGYSDERHDGTETIVWENDTPFTENRYLVVDSAGVSGEYYLSVVVE